MRNTTRSKLEDSSLETLFMCHFALDLPVRHNITANSGRETPPLFVATMTHDAGHLGVNRIDCANGVHERAFGAGGLDLYLVTAFEVFSGVCLF
mmetsp:Transcript_24788/g.51866  ORF Transcript_24788/g.51866 Transcript_24788/m.51866 type:complete len:94 (-) Transcript_24788:8-289(-)